MPDDADTIENYEIDFAVDECWELLESHGITPTVALVVALWDWREKARNGA